MGAVIRPAIAGAALLVAGCGQSAGDSATPIRLPLSAAASAATPDPIPTNPPGPYVWTAAASARAAWFGPADAPALLSVACEGWDKGAARLVVVRFARAERGAKALFAIQGSKGILRLPVGAVKVGNSGYVWRGAIDAGDPRVEALLGSGLKATVPGGGMIEVSPMGAAGRLVSECMAAGRTAAKPSA